MTPDGANPGGKRFVITTVEVEGREEIKVVELPAFEPEPWGAGEALDIVGKRLPRVDAREKVTGRARYTADIQRPGMLHAAIVRASIPSGRLVTLDLTAALAMPGVVDAIASADLARPMRAGGVRLFDHTIRYAGQPIAAICAESAAEATRAASAVLVTYEIARHAVTFDEAVADDAPPVQADGNLSATSPIVVARGDVNAGLADAEVVLTREYRTPTALHTAMEPHGAVAEWEDDRLTIWESTQAIFTVRDQVAGALGIPRSKVRVLKDHMGGGFGAKTSAGAHTFVAALLARRTGRAVRCVLDREGEQTDTGQRPSTWQRVTLGAKRDGRLTAIVAEAHIPLGVAGWEAPPLKIYHEMYSCPNVRTMETFAYINAQQLQAFRAPGHVEGAFGLERAMDVLGRELGIDAVELRLRNFAEQDEEKSRPYSANNLRRCYEEGAARFGWPRGGQTGADAMAGREDDGRGNTVIPKAGRGGTLHSGGGPRRRGIGMAAQVWGAGGGPPAYATVRINSDGTADVLAGTQDLGTGARTVLAQIAAESLGARIDQVRVVLGDTERTPFNGPSWGSMTTPSVGPAVRMAAVDARRKFLEAAAEIMECDPADLDAKQGVITTTCGARTMTFAAIAKKLGNVMIMGHGTRGPNPQGLGLMSFGVQFAEVEVDLGTGVVKVLRIVAAHDAGRIINPLLAESQLEGGIIQGLGFALTEERVMDRTTGRQMNPTMHEYKIPTMADIPRIDAFCIDSVDTAANHIGARGLAEPPIIPTAPAIGNAVADALGVEIDEIPLTPWRILRALGH